MRFPPILSHSCLISTALFRIAHCFEIVPGFGAVWWFGQKQGAW